MTIACVLRRGAGYTVEWVHALKRGIARHMSLRYRAPLADPEPGTWTFVCLTDVGPFGSESIALAHDWPGWWSKIEMLRPGLFLGPTLYLDLDSLVVGDLAPFATYSGDLALLSDFYRPQLAQSGVMLFNPGPATAALWRTFSASAAQYMRRYRGDGEWLHAHARRPERVQDLYPDAVVSYKVHARQGPPEGARIVACHGRPKCDDPKSGWLHREWSRLVA